MEDKDKKETRNIRAKGGNSNYQFYEPGRIDTESQEKQEINDIEKLILKFHKKETTIKDITETDINDLLEIDISELRKKGKLNGKLILICEATQEYLRTHKEEILKRMQKEKEEELDEER